MGPAPCGLLQKGQVCVALPRDRVLRQGLGSGLSSVLLVLAQSTDKPSRSEHPVFLPKVQNSRASPEIVISQ